MASDAAKATAAAAEREGKSYWGMSARACDSCRGAAALLFCRADSAFLCLGCDARVHGANRLASRHERVWMCEVCEQAPAAVTCKADAAALCTSCDADIHSANPLSRRHERTPVVPFCHSPAAGDRRLATQGGGGDDDDEKEEEEKDENEEDVTAAWLLGSSLNKAGEEKEKMKQPPAGAAAGDGFFYPEVDPYLDLDYAASMDARFHHMDSVVPVQHQQHNRGATTPPIQHHGQAVLGAPYDFAAVKPSYSYAPSLSHSVSSSDVGVVPDGGALADVSNPYVTGVPANPAALMGQAAVVAPAVGMDREARVLRYREKRKNRKFEKTIRYASRKAYAETRPRIKGRFAKRTEAEQDSGVDSMLAARGGGGGVYSVASQGLMLDHGYGIVPSF